MHTLSSLQNKRVLVGISGGIAAYKVPELVRRLKGAGAEVKVVMTESAREFVTPLTLQAVSGERVHTTLLDADAEAGMGHIELARWGDVIVIAPATADTLARFASGRADDLLGTLLRASTAPVLLAPAMNQAMWADAVNQQNIERLAELGFHQVGPESGSQACGDVGLGRMSEPDAIAEATASLFDTGLLAGKRVLITAGPTREAIDPVRYISNHSSGKMGFALAQAAADAGAKVTLVVGPVALATPDRVERIDVESAQSMLDAVQARVDSADVFIASAAVADFRVAAPAEQKLKKQSGQEHMTLELIKNPDILASVAALDDAPFCVGFAAETENVIEHATAKLQRKNLQMIIANDVSRADIGFSSEHNEITVLTRSVCVDSNVSANNRGANETSAYKSSSKVNSVALAKASKAQLGRQIIAILADQLVES